MGIAHHGAYVIWFEMGRVDWLKQRGMDYRDMEAGGLFLAVSRLELNYKRSARFDDALELTTHLSEVKSRFVAFTYDLRRPADGAQIASGSSAHIPMNPGGGAIRIPETYFKALSALQGT